MVESSVKDGKIDENNFKPLLMPNLKVSEETHVVIAFDKPNESFAAGKAFTGTVRVMCKGKFEAISITLRLFGYTRVSCVSAIDKSD